MADPWLQEILVPQKFEERFGIPLLIADLETTHTGRAALDAENQTARPLTDAEIDGYLRGMIVPTCGNLFHGVDLADGRYPIPDFPEMPDGAILDIGCNWGRWTIAGALAGHRMVGVDVHLTSLLVAQRLAQRLVPHNLPQFVLADARNLPFKDGVFDGVFSYSVVQHFSRANATAILGESGRVLRSGGEALIQMPNRSGIKIMLAGDVARQPDVEFNVRYYEIDDLLDMFRAQIGPSNWGIDCFLGLNVHKRDRPLVPKSKRWIIDIAELLRGIGKVAPWVNRYADSVFISARK